MELSTVKDVKRPMKRAWFLLPFLACFLIGTQSSGILTRFAQTLAKRTPQLNKTVAVIEANGASPWMVDAKRLPPAEYFNAVEFSDALHGWAGSREGSLYKTTDGGKNWESISITPSRTRIGGISFVSDLTGWVVVQRYRLNDQDIDEGQIWIQHTVDGGRTWRLQYTGKGLKIDRLRFISEREGWAVGTRTVRRRLPQAEYFVLHTDDGGETWTEVSESLNHLVMDSEGQVQDRIVDLNTSEPNQAVLLSGNGLLFKTHDGGQSWRQTGQVKLGPMIIWLLLGSGNQLQVAGGIGGDLGSVGMLAYEGGDKSWSMFLLSNIYVNGAVRLSDNQLLVCGSRRIARSQARFDDGLEGVVLYSSNNGLNWTIIYNDSKVKSINALTVADSDHVWAVGEEGLILNLALSK